jgi:hypothetical protein
VSISATCACGLFLQTDAANAGHVLQCPRCGRDWAVPGSGISSKVFHVGDDFHAMRSKKRLPITGIVLGILGCFYLLLCLASGESPEPARRMRCTNNLRQIGLAMLNYHVMHEYLPAAAITDKNGNPLLSWRVTLLPFMESSSLYDKFHLDEPWNSPHNLALVDQMPAFYKCPSDKGLKPGMTGYQVVVGRETAFTPDNQGLRFADFTDGLMNTILVGESDHSVPWTKPEDIPAEIALHVKGLVGRHGNHVNGFNAVFGDGSVKFLKSTIDPQVLYRLLTRNRGEAVAADSY